MQRVALPNSAVGQSFPATKSGLTAIRLCSEQTWQCSLGRQLQFNFVLLSMMNLPKPIDKKSLVRRHGHAPVAACLKQRFHGQNDASAGMRRQG